jgi:hypothetical protein
MTYHAGIMGDIISRRLADMDGESDAIPSATAAVGTPYFRKPYDQMSKWFKGGLKLCMRRCYPKLNETLKDDDASP